MSTEKNADMAKWLGIIVVFLGQAFGVIQYFNTKVETLTAKIHEIEITLTYREQFIKNAVIFENKLNDVENRVRGIEGTQSQNFRDIYKIKRELKSLED